MTSSPSYLRISSIIKRFTKMAARSQSDNGVSRQPRSQRCGPFVMPRVEFQRRKATHKRPLVHTRGSLTPRFLRVLLGRPPRHSRRVLTGPRGSHTKSRVRLSGQTVRATKRSAWVLSLGSRRLDDHVNYALLSVTSLGINFCHPDRASSR